MNAVDRCDRCSAQALVMTIHSGLTLLWCGHHYSKFEYLLKDNIYVDERQRLATTV